MQLVEIEWLDAHCSLSEITREEAAALRHKRTFSVGYLIAQNDAGVTIAVDHCPDEPESFAHWHHIPREMLVSVTALAVPVVRED